MNLNHACLIFNKNNNNLIEIEKIFDGNILESLNEKEITCSKLGEKKTWLLKKEGLRKKILDYYWSKTAGLCLT